MPEKDSKSCMRDTNLSLFYRLSYSTQATKEKAHIVCMTDPFPPEIHLQNIYNRHSYITQKSAV